MVVVIGVRHGEVLLLFLHFFVCGRDYIFIPRSGYGAFMSFKAETEKACHNRDTPCALEVVYGASNVALSEGPMLAYEGSRSLKPDIKLKASMLS
jgi:hypothetical protein